MNFTVTAAKRNFFDRNSVLSAIGAARAKVLTRQGALVRTIMQRSMRRKKGPAAPGEPPNAHQGNIRDKVYFAYDPRSSSCVVGPVKLGQGIAPEIQDKGGTVPVYGVHHRNGLFVPLYAMSAAGRRAAMGSGKVVKVMCKVEARPFSMPALLKAKPMLAKEWQGAVKKR